MSQNSQNVINFIHRRKKELREVFHSKCCLCGFNEVPEALEFHHVNPEEKEFAIGGSNAVTKALEPQLEEMKKCILVCANCHRGIHNGYYQIPDNWKDFYDEGYAQILREKLEKVKTHKINFCARCGKEIDRKSTHCAECRYIISRTCDRPSREELKNLIRTITFVEIGKKYGVTDNAIKKWCDGYSLPRRKSDIKQYSDEEWEKI